MSRKHLQSSFDVHTGTCENVFPHHECEIAQSEALSGKPLARYWLHTGPVTVDGQPMSRDNQNMVTARQMLDAGFRGSVIRVALLSEPYRKPLDFGESCMDRARPKVNAFLGFREYLLSAAGEWPKSGSSRRLEPAAWITETDAQVQSAMDDDLDYARALDAVVTRTQRLEPEQVGDARTALEALGRWDRVLGIVG